MKCYKPIKIQYKDKETGKLKNILVRCNKCMGCQEEIKKEYTYRMLNEAKYYKYIYFITLTYDDEHLPIVNFEYEKDGITFEGYTATLDKKEITDYLKTININVKRHIKKDLQDYKYFLAGEYGDIGDRPHYHLILLCNTQDIPKIAIAKWFNGKVDLQNGTISSVFYTVGYVNKKIGVDDWKYKYKQEPFRKFSKGLGKRYYEDNKLKMAEQYSGQLGFSKIPLPAYYKRKLKDEDLVDIADLERKAIENNNEIMRYLEIVHEKDIITQGEFDFMQIMKEQFKQRERNYKAKANMRSSRKL